MKLVAACVLGLSLLLATEAKAQTVTPPAGTCPAVELVTNIGLGILTVPISATNLGMALGSTFGSSRGVGIGSVVTGGLGIAAGIASLYFIAPFSILRCNIAGPAAFGATALAMGGFAIGMGIYRIVMSSKPKGPVTFLPNAYPVVDERTKSYGFVGGLTLVH